MFLLKRTPRPRSTLTAIVAQSVAYMSGAIVGVLVMLTFADSKILLNLELGDRPLLWYLAIFSAILALSRSAVPNQDGNFLPKEVGRQAAWVCVSVHGAYDEIKWPCRFVAPML